MPSPDERIASVEAQVQDQAHALSEVRDAIRHFEQRVDGRLAAVDTRLAAIDHRFDGLDHHFDTLERRIDRLDDKASRQFIWTVGIQITVLIAIVSAFVTIVGVVLSQA